MQLPLGGWGEILRGEGIGGRLSERHEGNVGGRGGGNGVQETEYGVGWRVHTSFPGSCGVGAHNQEGVGLQDSTRCLLVEAHVHTEKVGDAHRGRVC